MKKVFDLLGFVLLGLAAGTRFFNGEWLTGLFVAIGALLIIISDPQPRVKKEKHEEK